MNHCCPIMLQKAKARHNSKLSCCLRGTAGTAAPGPPSRTAPAGVAVPLGPTWAPQAVATLPGQPQPVVLGPGHFYPAQASLTAVDTTEPPTGPADFTRSSSRCGAPLCSPAFGPLRFTAVMPTPSLMSLHAPSQPLLPGRPIPGALNSCCEAPFHSTSPTRTCSRLDSQFRGKGSCPGVHEPQGDTAHGGHAARGWSLLVERKIF